MALSAGSRLGPYEVLAPIGAGGMGEVYRARDTRLKRDVAVKVLPDHVARDPETLTRFEREAQTVAGLNDPHVCSLFDVGTEGDVHYAVFELLEGDTLRERLAHGALSSSKATELAMQMCQGLAAAHAKGIVHRDLKPENLFLTRQGLKILDFGLAKLGPAVVGAVGEEDLSKEQTLEQLTSPGVAPGTVAYMSPEQARGEPADARSDIFATGIVLFEMLSGERPFRRATHPETLTAILREEPPELISPTGPVPPGLERITRRCLAKDPEDRFQSAHDLAFALEAVSGTSAPVRPAAPPRGRWIWAAALVVLVAIAGLWVSWPHEPRTPLRIRPITSDPDPEMVPAISPDGNQVAFVKDHEGELALYVKLIDGGDPLLLTQSAMGTFCPTWSPDGLRIAFARHVEGEDGELVDGIFAVPALGGTARRLATLRGHSDLSHRLSWSPDQKTLAIADRDTSEEPTGIFLLALETGLRQRLTRPPVTSAGDSFPRFSPDGRTLAFVRSEAPFKTDIYVTGVEGGTERRLTVGNLATEALDWAADGRSIVFSSWRQGGADLVGLWRVPVSGGDPAPLQFGERGSWPSISRTGRRLAYVQKQVTLNIWRAGGPTASEGERSAARLISSTRWDYHARYSPDGKWIAFASLRSGAAEVWVCDSDGSNLQQLTFLDEPMAYFPIWSPDGKRLAFTSSSKEGDNRAYVISVSGGAPRPVIAVQARDITGGWSRDGRWIYFASKRSGQREIWKVSPEGGDAIQVTTQGGTWASESHDGRFLYYSKSNIREGPPGIWRIPAGGGQEVQVLDSVQSTHWAVLERGILYLDSSRRPRTLELFNFARGNVTTVAEVELPYVNPGFSVSPDERWVLLGGSKSFESDIILVENFE